MPLLGARTAQQMDLITIHYDNIAATEDIPNTKDAVIRRHADVFNGLGKMPGKVHLHVDPDIEPVVMPPRRVPLHGST